MKSKTLLGTLLLSTAAIIWGGMFVVVKVVVTIIPPIQLVWLRYLIAAVILGLISWLRHEHWYFTKHDLYLLILIGLIGNTLSIVAQETGTWLSTAQTGAVVTSSTPTFMIIFAWAILHERLTHLKILSVMMATVGVFMIIGIHFQGKNIFLGILSLLVAAVTWALMSVLVKKVSPQYSSLQITLFATLVALIVLSPVILVQRQTLMSINFANPIVIGCLLYLGCISTAVAFIMWNQGLQLIEASRSGLFFLLQPIAGTLLGWLCLGETITWGFFIGCLLIISSVWMTIRFND
ncbi:hypothetical protein [Lactobacillus heilongjiangensis] [Lactiplantibacillus mudanjiangensis]|nr:hypothetical protein [Lactobacillus heilongjiangensis] [Lactiplantibacillus mudanjiangensis]